MSFDYKSTFSLPRSMTPDACRLHSSYPLYENDYVHLISSDLWEAITGEKQPPIGNCHFCNVNADFVTTQGEYPNQYLQMAKDRQGSRNLQQKIQAASESERNMIINELLPYLSQLVYDPCANYVIQKICDYCNESQRKVFLDFFLNNIQTIVEHQNGCRVLQKFIETIDSEKVDQLFLSLKPNLLRLCVSLNGNHIVQAFIEALPHRVSEIVDIIKDNVINLVVDNCGCRVVQKLFEKEDIRNLKVIVDRVSQCGVDLAINQYGNYVIQNILEGGSTAQVDYLFGLFVGHFYQFSIHKFASNVIEKLIRRASSTQKERIFSEIIGTENNYDTKRILQLVGDQFGNYVIQRILENGTESQLNIIYEVVYDNFDTITRSPYSKHVFSKLQSLGFEF
ncbi:Pumilio-family RNA binding repeat containing protein [Histomonas meleagridis]|uniref:Pumilio-family RNA binding repeat containing protein n=1 Tax=Histomonas meleagridis TaxID=135588 RepID=UPI0035593FC5|nr:Pumilio-family RNA binding repeat containing protein [Histomonas meleagridis]